MSEVTQAVIDAVEPKLMEVVVAAKDQFMADYGDWIQSGHRVLLEEAFLAAGKAKVACFLAKTPEDAQDAQETYDTCVRSLATLGLDVKITAEVEARRLLVMGFERVLGLIPVVAGVVVKVGLSFIPGVGALAGAVAGPGVELLLDQFFK